MRERGVEFIFRLGFQFVFLEPQKQPKLFSTGEKEKDPCKSTTNIAVTLECFNVKGSCEYF